MGCNPALYWARRERVTPHGKKKMGKGMFTKMKVTNHL